MIAKVCAVTLLLAAACLACHVPGHLPGLCRCFPPPPPCAHLGWGGVFGGPGLGYLGGPGAGYLSGPGLGYLGGPGLGYLGGPGAGYLGGPGASVTSRHHHEPGHSSAGASGCGCGCVDAVAEGSGTDSSATAGLTGHFY